MTGLKGHNARLAFLDGCHSSGLAVTRPLDVLNTATSTFAIGQGTLESWFPFSENRRPVSDRAVPVSNRARRFQGPGPAFENFRGQFSWHQICPRQFYCEHDSAWIKLN